MPSQMKQCTLCSKYKPLFEFAIKKKSDKKREQHCNDCRKTYKIHHKHLKPKKHRTQPGNYYTGKRLAKSSRPYQREKLRRFGLQTFVRPLVCRLWGR